MRVPGKTLGLMSTALGVMAFAACSRGPTVQGECHALDAAAGVNDIELDAERGIAYLAYLNREPTEDGKKPTGTVMLVDLNAAKPRVRAALVTEPTGFRPTHVRLRRSPQGARQLLVTDADGSLRTFEQSATGGFVLVSAPVTLEQSSDEHDARGNSQRVVTRGTRTLVGSLEAPYLQLCETK